MNRTSQFGLTSEAPDLITAVLFAVHRSWHVKDVQMAILVRPISLEDIGSFRETLDEVARERRHLALLEAPPLEELRRVVQSNVEQHHGIHFVAVESGEVIGWCDIRPRKEPGFTHIGLLGIGVRPNYRRQGIGHRLLTAAVETALSEGLASSPGCK